jgi:uncharacterized protein (TIGR03083 family)
MDFRRTYRAAAVSFADLVSRLPESLDRPGLGGWTLGELVGHTVSAGVRQVPEVLAVPASSVTIDSAEGYWAAARSAPAELLEAGQKASDADAAQSLAALGDDRARTVGELVGQATAALAAAGDDDVVTSAIGGMRVRDWIPTRTLELVVHGVDVATAAGVPFEPPAAAVAESTVLLARIAAAVGDGPQLVRALTGRGTLGEGFSVLV